MNRALTLFDNFNQLTPYAVGFDRIFNDLQRYTENTVTSLPVIEITPKDIIDTARQFNAFINEK